MRGLLARRGWDYRRLAEALTGSGHDLSHKAVDHKIQRGSFECAFFLHSMHIIGASHPPQWRKALRTAGNWNIRASHVLRYEMARWPGVDWQELSHRLATIGVAVTDDFLQQKVSAGSYPLTLLLQYASVFWVEGIEMLVDRDDLRAACRPISPPPAYLPFDDEISS
ncbi:hypothetical protein AYM40_06550 [Paraburkholderia phytofirmans OLGA172]|uniref:DUF6471 domain-containing protein n=2 Tax=Paraburkholderia phytofirmans TaxID=261302 RepID=A0A167VVQ4_9BURK|nr:hypothetical protein AYM40_06550 [Paraburkholderia phytofirmans OLGA172]